MSQVEPKGKGTWRQVAAVIDGRNIPVGSGALMTVTAEGYTVKVNGRMYQRGTSKADYDKNPHQADVLVAEGPHAGKTLEQIFKIEGDVLIANAALPGKPRPTEFTSLPGSGHVLTVWLRTQADAAPPGPLTWQVWVIIAVIAITSIVLGSLKKNLEASSGHWVSLLVGGLAVALVVTAVGLLLKWGWRGAVTTGITISVILTVFDELQKTLEPTLGTFGAIAVSGSTAIVAGIIVGTVLGRLLKTR